MKKRMNVNQRKDIPGRDKPVWLRIGKAWEEDGKVSIKLDVLPLPNDKNEIWLSLFDDDRRELSKQDDDVWGSNG